MTKLGVVADIGGTNSRFALCNSEGDISDIKVFNSSNYNGLEDIFKAYLREVGYKGYPAIAAIAIPGSVVDGKISLANLHWDSYVIDAWEKLGLDYLTIVNDLAAHALCIPIVAEEKKVRIGTHGVSMDASPIIVIGPGTGLGLSCLIPDENSYISIPTEAGHSSAASYDEESDRVITAIRKETGHVSYEKVVSGQGIENIYKVLSGRKLSAPEICIQATSGNELSCKAFDMFFSLLASFAGSMALAHGALGGVYLSGGILAVPDVLKMFNEFDFRRFFEDKGRFSWYVKEIGTYLLQEEHPGLMGLSTIIRDYFKNSA